MLNYTLLTTNEALAEVCRQARQCPCVAIDTEFVRTRTYYPQLGLLQLFDGERLSLIDPLAITAWEPLKALLSDTAVIKYLHAGSEDLDVFLHQYGLVPSPVIDTQVLAAFSGKPLSCSFATLVEMWCGEILDKSESRTDWLARPLTQRQLEYAAADVWWLLPVAKKQQEEAAAAGWLEDALDECRCFCQRRQQIMAPEEAWRDITNAGQLRPRQLAALRLLAAWRLRTARKKDMAVNFVVKEEHLWQVARYLPGSLGELHHLGLTGHEIRFHGKMLLEWVREAQQLAEEALPEPLWNLTEHPHYRKVFKALKAAVLQVSQENGLPQELLASRRQINQLLNGYWQPQAGRTLPELLTGWRRKWLEAPLMAVLAEYPNQ
ncbi:ribonuclease D [Enterobacteriaceae bacterium LUAb1]